MSAERTQVANRYPKGFTLIELIVFIVIVSVALAGLLAVFNITTKASADPIQPKQAILVAESMLEEILLKAYANPAGGYPAACPATCDRAQFDDVSDYHNYSSTGVYSLDNLTTPVAGLTAYNVAVSVAAASVTATGNSLAGLRITVTVTVGGNTYTLAGYRFNYD
jgi:MSHA pilin protein MshD